MRGEGKERGSSVDGQLERRKECERKTNSGGCTKESGVKKM